MRSTVKMLRKRCKFVICLVMIYAGYCVLTASLKGSTIIVMRSVPRYAIPEGPRISDEKLLDGEHVVGAPSDHVTAAPSDHVTTASSDHVTVDSSDHVTKVILYTYMRGGSTLSGEFLAQDKDTFYLFEMVDGMVSHLYGTTWGIFPLDILYYTDGTKRPLSDAEKQYIVDASLQLLSCNFTLPADVTFQKFMIDRIYPPTVRYIDCLMGNSSDRVYEAADCKSKLSNYCPRYFRKVAKTPGDCYNHFHVSPNASFLQLPAFQAHDECMKKAQKRADECEDILTQSCLQRKVRSFKTVRLSMEMVESMILKEPDLRIVYLVRDPRGIVNSRYSLDMLSAYAILLPRKKLQREAEVLCHRMAFDNEIYKVLVEKYPRNILRVRYEDIATQPMQQGQRFYKFIRDIALPETIREFIQKSMNSTHDDGFLGTSRRNSTATAFNWRKRLKAQQITDINSVCKSVIEDLGYEL